MTDGSRVEKRVECPLCLSSGRIVIRENIDVGHLNSLYQRQFGVHQALQVGALSYCECEDCGLRFFSPLVAGGEQLYRILQRFDWYYMDSKHEYDVAEKYLRGARSVLEVGAGKAAFAARVGDGVYVGLEFNDDAIRRGRDAGVRLLKESVETHATRGALYDAVVSFQVLEHVSDPCGFLSACVKCLNKGGVLIIAVPAQDGFIGEALNNILNLPPHHVTHWSERVLRYIAPKIGLDLLAIEYEPVAEYHRAWATKSQWENRLRKLLGLSWGLVDRSLVGRLTSKLAEKLGRIWELDGRNLRGHTVVAVYRKR